MKRPVTTPFALTPVAENSSAGATDNLDMDISNLDMKQSAAPMNITIRKMQGSDTDALYRLLSDPEVMRYLEPPYDRAQTEAFLHHAGLTAHPLVYAVEESERFIGYVIYHAYDKESVEIGWAIFPEYWGRGYASALTDQLICRARREQKGVVIECVPAQEATVRIAIKKGFHYCGVCDGLAIYRLAH